MRKHFGTERRVLYCPRHVPKRANDTQTKLLCHRADSNDRSHSLGHPSADSKKHPPMAAQGPLMQRSARTQLQATNEAYTIMGPTTIREVEDQVPTVDERGHRHVVIRTRKLETILGSVGPTEIERERRHTLPGQGHVIPLSDTEFEVFHNHAKLHLDIGGLHATGTSGGARSEQPMRQRRQRTTTRESRSNTRSP